MTDKAGKNALFFNSNKMPMNVTLFGTGLVRCSKGSLIPTLAHCGLVVSDSNVWKSGFLTIFSFSFSVVSQNK